MVAVPNIKAFEKFDLDSENVLIKSGGRKIGGPLISQLSQSLSRVGPFVAAVPLICKCSQGREMI